jgi:uncharacterized protein (TIGR03437 family)
LAPFKSQAAATVDAATYTPRVAPGQIVALFGEDLVVGDGFASASSIPLPRSLQKTTVYVNGVAAPLYFTSGSQINYQMPYSTAVGQASVVVMRDDGVASYGTVSVAATSAALFTVSLSGGGQAVAQNYPDYSLNGDPGTPGAPAQAKRAKKGDYLILYGSGAGAQLIDAGTREPLTVKDGEAASGNPLIVTAANPTAAIGGKAASVGFSGLVPGFVGLWQLNVQVPTDAPSGAAVDLIINLDGRTSKAVTIAIE